MNLSNLHIYDLAESVVASGLPMVTDYNTEEFQKKVLTFVEQRSRGVEANNPDFQRAVKLAANPAGTGHNNFLAGVLVSVNITATQVWWQQFQRYHFAQIVSSQSKMHRLRAMLKDCTFTYPRDILDLGAFAYVLQGADGMPDEELAYACPMGLELTARVTTNYLQLKTIYAQRKDHKLEEWRKFCGWVKGLPYAKEFITGEKDADHCSDEH